MRFEIDFSAGGNAKDYLRSGWSDQEKKHIWSLGARSVLALPKLPAGTRVQVEVELEGLVEMQGQSLAIMTGSEKIEDFAVGERCRLVFTISPRAEPSETDIIEFVHEQYREAGTHSDPRPLALRFFHIAFIPDA